LRLILVENRRNYEDYKLETEMEKDVIESETELKTIEKVRNEKK
jgi:hypothetical protein